MFADKFDKIQCSKNHMYIQFRIVIGIKITHTHTQFARDYFIRYFRLLPVKHLSRDRSSSSVNIVHREISQLTLLLVTWFMRFHACMCACVCMSIDDGSYAFHSDFFATHALRKMPPSSNRKRNKEEEKSLYGVRKFDNYVIKCSP